MGVKNLWDILESCKQTLPLHHLQNKKLCVDLSCWLVQLAKSCKSPGCVREKVYLKNLFHRLRALIALNCSLIFVTDGSIPSIKLATYRKRLGSNVLVNKMDCTKAVQPVPSLRRNKGSEFSCMINEAKILAMALGIPSLDGIEEGEAQCAALNSASFCDGCFSSDSDIFLFGARTVYRDIILGDSGCVVCYEMADIETKLGFGRNSLVSLSLLLGSDYTNGVHGFGTETACKFVKSIGDESILSQIALEGVAATRKKREKDKSEKDKREKYKSEKDKRDKDKREKEPCFNINKENGNLCVKANNNSEIENVGPETQFKEIIEAYMKPKCHSPDSDPVQRVCAEQPFLRSELQQLCEMFFGWTHEKTDEYILPKIAERDLRRFANLRSSSSALGLNTIPVACPVSAIIKTRKVQGKDYYEVSWRNIDGLNVSSVPAELIQRACPEKITEFLTKKDEKNKQKRKPRPKKQNNNNDKSTINEIDEKLKDLLISIESESSSNPLAEITNVSQQENNLKNDFERDFVDLCTPSPAVRASKAAKCHKPIGRKIDVIEICDSD
ncbi:hypothetical protein LUZ60_012094 [Juncus effusus]|nr:hypothetical protein LUZ60_012094 [Juncus effusus]